MIEQQFDKLIENHQPTKVKKFRQSRYATLFPTSRHSGALTANGVCRALSAAFIVRNWTRGLEKNEGDFQLDVMFRMAPPQFEEAMRFSKNENRPLPDDPKPEPGKMGK